MLAIDPLSFYTKRGRPALAREKQTDLPHRIPVLTKALGYMSLQRIRRLAVKRELMLYDLFRVLLLSVSAW
jgi:hypothetical protein